jgi:hypothetical protein
MEWSSGDAWPGHMASSDLWRLRQRSGMSPTSRDAAAALFNLCGGGFVPGKLSKRKLGLAAFWRIAPADMGPAIASEIKDSLLLPEG